MRTAHSSSRLLGGSASVHGGIPPLGVCLQTPLGVDLATPSGVGLETPWVWPGPHGCVPGDPPRLDPSTSSLGVGLETPPGQTHQLPPGCGSGDLQCLLGYHPPPL